jgi:hypothetical protein
MIIVITWYRRKWLWTNLMYYLENCMKGFNKTTRNLSNDLRNGIWTQDRPNLKQKYEQLGRIMKHVPNDNAYSQVFTRVNNVWCFLNTADVPTVDHLMLVSMPPYIWCRLRVTEIFNGITGTLRHHSRRNIMRILKVKSGDLGGQTLDHQQ